MGVGVVGDSAMGVDWTCAGAWGAWVDCSMGEGAWVSGEGAATKALFPESSEPSRVL